MKRNRSQGWKHAKITGHQNEHLVRNELGDNYSILNTKVESIFGDKTIPKTDIYGPKNHSLKKSLGGQVHMNKVQRFVDGYEILYGDIPSNVKNVLFLMFGGSDTVDNILKNNKYIHPNPKIRNIEIKRKTISAETIIRYDSNIHNEFIVWMKGNIKNVTELVFMKGWVKNESDWVDILWYKNNMGENNVDEKFLVNDIIDKCDGDNVSYGTKNGGTTINLPFGHLQYHQGGLQFHHSYKKIKKMFSC
jgi:hypothetical protein